MKLFSKLDTAKEKVGSLEEMLVETSKLKCKD